jgi:hypothetical protein
MGKETELHGRFTEAANNTMANLEAKGITIQAFYDPKLPHFTALSTTEKLDVTSHLKGMETVLSQLDTPAAHSAPTLAQTYIKHMRYTVADEVWGYIDETDVVDIYGQDNRLKFASLRLFGAVSYSIEDVFCRSWLELYHRSREDVLQQIYKVCEEIILKARKDIVHMDSLPLHSCVEIDSPLKRQFVLRAKVFAPVHKIDRLVGFMCVNRGSVFTKKD